MVYRITVRIIHTARSKHTNEIHITAYINKLSHICTYTTRQSSAHLKCTCTNANLERYFWLTAYLTYRHTFTYIKMYLLEMPYALWQFALGPPLHWQACSHTHSYTRMLLRSGDSPLLMLLQAIWLLVVFVFPSKPKISERICCCRLLLLMFVLFACALFSYSFAYNKIKDCVWDFVFADLKRKPSANKRSTALAMP